MGKSQMAASTQTDRDPLDNEFPCRFLQSKARWLGLHSLLHLSVRGQGSQVKEIPRNFQQQPKGSPLNKSQERKHSKERGCKVNGRVCVHPLTEHHPLTAEKPRHQQRQAQCNAVCCFDFFFFQEQLENIFLSKISHLFDYVSQAKRSRLNMAQRALSCKLCHRVISSQHKPKGLAKILLVEKS